MTKWLKFSLALALSISLVIPSGTACTGITLRAKDGAIVYGRTLEWGSFDLKSRVIVIARGYAFSGNTPAGKTGMKWTAKFGVVGIDILEKEIIADGINEKGLALGTFYHPGFADYAAFEEASASISMAATDLPQYILTRFASIDEVRNEIGKIRIVSVVEPALGFPAPVHFMISDPSGQQIVIEFSEGNTKIFDAPLGVITNAPTYDWHIINLRNYVNLSPVAIPAKKIEQIDFTPLGGGSGMIGLPGDFTPPSRFVRAVAFSQTARPTSDGKETMYELFRILDNFNVPLGAAEGSASSGHSTEGMRSATIWTSVTDITNKILYYHTQHNRRVRAIDINAVDFDALKSGIKIVPLDREKTQDIEQVNLNAG